jgi:hypothetical protein
MIKPGDYAPDCEPRLDRVRIGSHTFAIAQVCIALPSLRCVSPYDAYMNRFLTGRAIQSGLSRMIKPGDYAPDCEPRLDHVRLGSHTFAIAQVCIAL